MCERAGSSQRDQTPSHSGAIVALPTRPSGGYVARTMTQSQRNPEDRTMAALLAPDILALLADSPRDIAVETEELHPADLADVVEHLPRERVRELLLALP